MNDILKLELTEIKHWIIEYFLFFTRPKKIVDSISAKSDDLIFRQFIFYFIIYTFSFFFLSIDSSFNDWLKIAIVSIIMVLPKIGLVLLACRLAGGNFNNRKLLIYMVFLSLISAPILNACLYAFLSLENYAVIFLFQILASILALYFLIGFAVVIDVNRKRAFKIFAFHYLILNLISFFLMRLDFDPYAPTNEVDPIYSEYKDFIEPLENKELIPTALNIITSNQGVETHFSLQDIITENISKSNNELEKNYLLKLDKNIEHVSKSIDNLKYRRNKNIAKIWLIYFNDIKAEISTKYKSVEEVEELKLEPIPLKDKVFKAFNVKIYLKRTDISKLMISQMKLKSYNNSIVTLHQNSEAYQNIFTGLVLLPANAVNYIYGDLILKEGEPKKYQDTFLPLE